MHIFSYIISFYSLSNIKII